jgi:NAD(P)-dependent dehydrogenase (short-subunit alcohol dehydrogenase family)
MIVDLQGRCAVVTGGASNIGCGITMELSASGARVILVDRDADQAKRVAECRPDLVTPWWADLADLAQLPELAAAIQAETGGVDILVNNAGWVRTVPFLDKDLTEAEFEVRLNLLSPLTLCHLFAPHMVEQGWGRIVSVASEAGRAGQRGQVAYGAAKGGILGLTRSLSHELGRDGVTVNAVSPAMVVPESADEIGAQSMQHDRDRPPEVMAKIVKHYPRGRVGRPRDIASVVAFLASDQADFITGQTIPVNGGFVTT